MVARRIIPCLDCKGGRTVKGTRFVGLRDVGDPVQLAQAYSEAGADELVLLDISATEEERGTMIDLVERVAEVLSIPFTVGGGISCRNDVYRLLSAGADKVSLNSAAVRTPALVGELAREFGSQCIVVAVDSKRGAEGDTVYINAGRLETHLRTQDWIREVVDRGAGEILLTSIDHDGVRQGFATELTADVGRLIPVPVIASGGAGTSGHFVEVFREGGADGALAAGGFHEGALTIREVKECMARSGIEVRI